MQQNKIIMAIALLFTFSTSFGQLDSNSHYTNKPAGFDREAISIQPGIGMRAKFGKDLMLTNLVLAHPRKHLSFAAHTSVSYNNLLQRNFNYIKTNYDYSISQTLGAGTTHFAKRASHSFLLMFGVKYNGFKETLENPKFEKVSASVSAMSPDLGFRYNFTYGVKKYFFHSGLYLPLYPYPVKTANIQAITGNLGNISLEVGVGIRMK